MNRAKTPKTTRPIAPGQDPNKIKPGTFDKLHRAGAARHGITWLVANIAAREAAELHGMPADKNKETLTLIVLRILDRIALPKKANPVYAKRLNPAQRTLLQDFYAVTGLEPLGQEDLDAGNITFAQLWEQNTRHMEEISATVCNLQNARAGLGL